MGFTVVLAISTAARALAAAPAATCPLLVQGTLRKDNSIPWGVFEKMPHHALISIVPTQVPCKGYMSNNIFRVRANSSDKNVWKAIFSNNEFEFLENLLQQPPKVIIDLGGNIGASAAFFGAKYPGATVIALEPSLSNHALAVMNTHQFSNIHMLRGAIWNEVKFLKIDLDRSLKGEWGFRTFDAGRLLCTES